LLFFLAGQFENALLRSVMDARLFIVILIHAGKLLKREYCVRILIAVNVKFIVLSKTSLM
jgi:hypothetical protein